MSAGDLETGRAFHEATVLTDGRVLVTGGHKNVSTAEIYDPATNSWATAGEMETARRNHSASLLPDGRVIVVGGGDSEDFPTETAEVFDPATVRFSPAGDLDLARQLHSATRLADGRVMIVGGGGHDGVLRWVEMFDSARGRWLAQGSSGSWAKGADLNQSRTTHSATLLGDGRVLVTGGRTKIVEQGEDARAGETVFLDSAEIYDPAAGRWSQTGALSHARGDHFAVRLADGRVLVSGGQFLGDSNDEGKRSIEVLSSSEIYDPGTGSWEPGSRHDVPPGSGIRASSWQTGVSLWRGAPGETAPSPRWRYTTLPPTPGKPQRPCPTSGPSR